MICCMISCTSAQDELNLHISIGLGGIYDWRGTIFLFLMDISALLSMVVWRFVVRQRRDVTDTPA